METKYTLKPSMGGGILYRVLIYSNCFRVLLNG